MNLAITGPTSGIGAETIKALSSQFEQLFLLVRNENKAQKLLKEINPDEKKKKFIIIHCDLSDLRSVVKAAEKIQNHTSSLNLLINNAGGIFPKRNITKDGLEMTFAVNHLGHFLLTQRLLPLLAASKDARIINISSEAHKAAKPNFNDLQSQIKYHSFLAYANAKLYNILFTKSLAEKYGDQNIRAYALHPGVVKTNFGREYSGILKVLVNVARIFMISPEEGAKTSIYLATSAAIKGSNGTYFKKSRKAKPSKTADSVQMRNKLWEESEKLVQGY